MGTNNLNLQSSPVDSGTPVFCVIIFTARWGPNRRHWDPGIPYLNTFIHTIQLKKNETELFTTKNGSAQFLGSNYIEDLQSLSV